MLRSWDDLYKTKRYDAPWDHVNSLIQRSRAIAQQCRQPQQHGDLPESLRPSAGVTQTHQQSWSADRTNGDNPSVVGDISADGRLLPDRQSNTMSFLNPAAAPTHPAWQFEDMFGEHHHDPGYTNADFLPDSADLEALNAVFADPSWAAFDPFSGIDVYHPMSDRVQ